MRLHKQNTRLQAPDVHGVEHIKKKKVKTTKQEMQPSFMPTADDKELP